ncbi:hypothetical protein L226DRAFT_80934 [Lentinus tigrinus ALCF2SS1-7]|uniref:uncharacterized protein n=1 Tax=Lentinus tigrinus ALCF2SS1-7 TaxID=1328758 RepID=UPI001165D0FD|nr:hypothetical protein L226DRAFT_80934 [Lentinus tigrinus ALCF2SS1-7]
MRLGAEVSDTSLDLLTHAHRAHSSTGRPGATHRQRPHAFYRSPTPDVSTRTRSLSKPVRSGDEQDTQLESESDRTTRPCPGLQDVVRDLRPSTKHEARPSPVARRTLRVSPSHAALASHRLRSESGEEQSHGRSACVSDANESGPAHDLGCGAKAASSGSCKTPSGLCAHRYTAEASHVALRPRA